MSRPRRSLLGAVLFAISIMSFFFIAGEDQVMSQIKLDEQVIFFPTSAQMSEDRQFWIAPIHGWIFEPETNGLLRSLAVRQLQSILGADPRQTGGAVFENRIRWFLVDNERGKRIAVRIGGQQRQLDASSRDGHFHGTIRLPVDIVQRQIRSGRLPFAAITGSADRRDFRGFVYFPPSTGVSVISDIDDTVKISNVANKKKLVEHTFLKEFQAVAGMAEVYRRWADAGALFHYVSASPWQLYEPLSKFASEAGLPDGTWHLKRFRLKDTSFLNLVQDPVKYKLPLIEQLVQSCPQRKFILVGDSGEKDPEIYGIAMRRCPQQILRIYIRNVSDESADATRYQEAFRDLTREKWQIFRDPAELRNLTDLF